MQYTYDTTPDEESGMDYELAVENGARMGRDPPLPIIDKQTLFVLKVADRWLRPASMQRLSARIDPIAQAFIRGDETIRAQIESAVATVTAKL